MLIFEVPPFEGPKIIRIEQHGDARGYFAEVWRQDILASAGIDTVFCQENQSLSAESGTVRGLHFQIGPAAQAKLIRCIRGAIFDVIVDLRRDSPTFGRYATIELSGENWVQLYVPEQFAHGYCTLEPNTEVLYKASSYYDRAAERGIAWDDPGLGIAWPVDRARAILSERDRSNPSLATYFQQTDHSPLPLI